jgi:PAS domain S-box-containing protein
MSIDSPQRVSTTPVKILHIDDDQSVLDLTRSFLNKELDAPRITTVTDPEAVLDRLRDETVHCIISDYDMPGRDGLELLQEVREQYPDLPFILYTGKGSEEIAADAINAGVTGYLQKGGPDQIQRLANRTQHAAMEYCRRIESERYSTVLRALGYPVYVVNEAAEFEYVNQEFVELTGYDRDEIIGSGPGLIKTDKGVEKANDILAEIVSSSGPNEQKFEVDIHSADGDVTPCYDHMAALPFEGTFRGSVGILRDATAEQQRREELIRQNERLDEFTSIVSHDLRTPLSNAKAAAHLARTAGDADAFDKLEAQHERMAEMIDDLLTLAREGETISETERVNVTTIATEAWDSFSCPANTLNLPDEELIVNGDAQRLRRLLENLLRNTVEHSPSPVTVTVRQLDNGFYVADNGPGIDEGERDKVFEPGHTTADNGTGFGLSIVKRIADAHGWEISLTDSNTGGARFEFTTDPPTQPTSTAVPIS